MERPDLPQITYTAFSDAIHNRVVDKNIPIDGTIELTQRCNLRCVQCYCCHDTSRNELDYAETCRVLDEIADAGCLWLLITGGEPLLRPDFLDIYMYAKKKGLLITLFTNGTLITEAIADHLKKYPPFSIEVSIYGATEETYEKVTRVAGSFESCVNGIRLILAGGLPLQLKTMALTLNRHEIFLMKEWAGSLGVEFKFDALLHPGLDGSKGPIGFRLSPEEAVGLDAADEEKSGRWIEVCGKSWDPVDPEKLFICGGGKYAFHIDPYGILRPCDMTRGLGYDLRGRSFHDAWSRLVSEVSSKKAVSGNRCAGCNIMPICNQCPGWAFLESGDMYGIAGHLCDVARIRAKTFGMARVN